MTTCVLFVQGGGAGAHSEDAPLADSLRRTLGPSYDVRFPQMPGESDPKVGPWKQKISAELSHASGKVILVGHSVGGSILLRYLAEEDVDNKIAGLFLLAAPAWDRDRWDFDDLKLPRDISEKLARIPRILFYHAVMTTLSRLLTLHFTAHRFRRLSLERSIAADTSSAMT